MNPDLPNQSAPSQADVILENEALKARIATLQGATPGPTPELAQAVARAATAEAEVLRLQKQLLTLDEGLEERAGKMAAVIVAQAGIVGSKDRSSDSGSSKPKSATEQALEARRREAGAK